MSKKSMHKRLLSHSLTSAGSRSSHTNTLLTTIEDYPGFLTVRQYIAIRGELARRAILASGRAA